MRMLRTAACAAVLATACFSGTALAQQKYPNKPVRMIVPFAPGGGTDIMARIIAQGMSEALGQSVIVDNRAGGGGTIGTETAVRAAPDGYTLIMVSGSYGTNAALHKQSYDPVKDIQAIVLLGETGFVVALHPTVPVKTIKEMIAYNKANPGKLNYASTGTGGITHLATELFDLMAGTKMTHIPYKGTGPALTDLLGGQVQLIFGSTPATLPHARSGKLRGIAVTTPKRIAPLPDVPTVGETVPGYDAVLWYGMWGPKGLPKDIILLWNREVAKILQTEQMKKRMAGDALDPGGGPPEQFLKVLERDVAKWTRVVKEAKITTSN
jgi:tripartite-type tricarboxylate transporter receptor subunit TctC